MGSFIGGMDIRRQQVSIKRFLEAGRETVGINMEGNNHSDSSHIQT